MAAEAGKRGGNRLLRTLFATAGLAIPTLSLIPLGSLWLWQNGYLLHWAAAAFCSVLLFVALEWWLLRRSGAVPDAASREMLEGQGWSEREKHAWEAVERFADSLEPTNVFGEKALTELAVKTIELVARHIHPGETHPIWNFTVPEALTMAERVSRRLRPILIENVPLGDQLTVRQLIKLYEWRVAADWAERAYDIWRIVRLLNPASAIANEAREQITKRMYAGIRDEFTVRLARFYVFEVARAAIDLYGGRLRNAGEPISIASDQTPLIAKAPSRFTRVARQAANAGGIAVRSLWGKRQPPAK